MHQASAVPAVSASQFSISHRAALSISAALLHWVEASARQYALNAKPSRRVDARGSRMLDAERRREAAIAQSLLMPRQF